MVLRGPNKIIREGRLVPHRPQFIVSAMTSVWIPNRINYIGKVHSNAKTEVYRKKENICTITARYVKKAVRPNLTSRKIKQLQC